MQRLISSLPRSLAFALIAGIFLGSAACDSSGGGPAQDDSLKIGFQTTTSTSTSSTASMSKASPDSVLVQGSNGTLKITDVRFIVEEFELGGEEDSLDFNAPPAFLDLPLNTSEFATAGRFGVSPGTYFDFEFEVDDLEPDEDDSAEERQQIEELLAQIREEFPDWPSDASMLVRGTFTPEGGEARSFKTFVEAEIEVERELNPPLEVTGEGLSRSLTVRMDPRVWFRTSDGGVRDLSQYQSTSDLLEIENEFEDGVVEIEIDDD